MGRSLYLRSILAIAECRPLSPQRPLLRTTLDRSGKRQEVGPATAAGRREQGANSILGGRKGRTRFGAATPKAKAASPSGRLSDESLHYSPNRCRMVPVDRYRALRFQGLIPQLYR